MNVEKSLNCITSENIFDTADDYIKQTPNFIKTQKTKFSSSSSQSNEIEELTPHARGEHSSEIELAGSQICKISSSIQRSTQISLNPKSSGRVLMNDLLDRKKRKKYKIQLPEFLITKQIRDFINFNTNKECSHPDVLVCDDNCVSQFSFVSQLIR